MIIGLDVDGTLWAHTYPELGCDVGAFPWLHKAARHGAKFIIVTMRDGQQLKDARTAFEAEGLELYAANTNPTQWRWTMSPKPYCHLYIDDAGLGIPLKRLPGERRDCVDWDKTGPMMLDRIAEWNRREHSVKPT